MIQEVTMEVVSLADASEMAVDGRVIDYELTDNGYKCRFLSEISSMNSEALVKEKKEVYVICASCSGSTLFVAQKGVTYNFSNAKRFDKTAASQKAFFMRKRGSLDWSTLKVN